MTHTTTQTTDKTGVETIDCDDCGVPHIVDYDTHAVSLAFDHDERSGSLDDDGQSFDCIDCGAKVQA